MSVEAPERSPTVRSNAVHQVRKPKPLCVIDPADPAPGVAFIHNRVSNWHTARGAGSHVFVDRENRAFVIPEDKPAALDWPVSRFADYVGFYTSKPRTAKERALGPQPWLAPTYEGLLEDIAEHMSQRT